MSRGSCLTLVMRRESSDWEYVNWCICKSGGPPTPDADVATMMVGCCRSNVCGLSIDDVLVVLVVVIIMGCCWEMDRSTGSIMLASSCFTTVMSPVFSWVIVSVILGLTVCSK